MLHRLYAHTTRQVRFTEPDQLRLNRDEGPVLSLAAESTTASARRSLARLEAQVMLPLLLQRFPNACPAGDPVRRAGLMIRRYTSLPIALNP